MVSGSVVVLGAEYGANKVFLFFPSNGTFKEYTLPTPNSGPVYISIEPGGTYIRAWFSEWWTNSIGEIIYDPSTGAATLYEFTLPPAAGGAAAGVFAGSGIIWFAGKSAIIKWDRAASQFTTWSIPAHPSTTASFVDLDSLGQVWYTSRTTDPTTTDNYVGVLRGDNTFKEWQFPAAGADPRVISVSPATQRPWIAEQGVAKIAQLDPSAGGVVTGPTAPVITPFAPVLGALVATVTGPVLPSSATVAPVASTIADSTTGQFSEWPLGAGSQPHDVVVDSSGNAWILESGANKVARLSPVTPDFTLGCAPSSVTMAQGGSGTSTCTVASLNGFSAAVDLSSSWVGAAPSGVQTVLPSPITPPSGGNATSNLAIGATPSASTGAFTARVTATSGSLTHTFDVAVQINAGVADFTITPSPSSLSLTPGTSAVSTIAVQSLGVFSAPVDLTSSGAPSGLNLVFGTTPVTPPAGGTASSILTVTVAGAAAGSYPITITGTSGALTHGATLTVQVVAAGGHCLIATATYGSELSDEVQFLRNFRDKSILKTNTGSNFMIAFNAWYYSFSPYVAQFIREHALARTVTKLMVYPLMGILRLGASVFYILPTNLEAAAVVSGLLTSSLIGIVYLSPPLAAALVSSSRARRAARRLQIPSVCILLGALLAVAFIATVGAPSIFMILCTVAIVLSTLAASALYVSRAVLRLTRRA
jgi:streptogramin lyase